MSDYLQSYLPEYDDEAERQKLSGFAKDDLLDMLIKAYKERRVLAMLLDEHDKKVAKAMAILAEPSSLMKMPGVPSAEDLRRKFEE